MTGKPVASYILQIVSRCNLNCTYCYVYNMGDESWRTMPHFMSPETISLTASRVHQHCKSHDLREVDIGLHGGEPLLFGKSRTRQLLECFDQTLNGIHIRWGMQSNGVLLDEEWVRIFLDHNLQVGISLDGPSLVNDRYRVDHHGKGSHARLMRSLRCLGSAEGQRVFAGCLAVIDPLSDPLEVFWHLLSLKPKAIHFLFPHGNWDTVPPSKRPDPLRTTPFGDWLISIFDEWFGHWSDRVQIRIFEEIIEHLAGGQGSLESLGVSPIPLIFVATNGDLEAVDTLKSIPGQQVLGMNLRDHSLDDALAHPKYLMRQMGLSSLADRCQSCHLVETCGAGYLPHRWSSAKAFRNPSVYCTDLSKLIMHIRRMVRKQLYLEAGSLTEAPNVERLA